MLNIIIVHTIFNSTSYEDYKSKIEPNNVLIGFHTNQSSISQNDFLYQLYHDISEQKFPEHFYLCTIVNDTWSDLVSVYFPGTSESEFEVKPTDDSLNLYRRILSESKHLIRHYKRILKEMKYPEIARIKEELRIVRKLIRKESNETRIRELEKDEYQLAEDLLKIVPPAKKAKRKTALILKMRKNTSERLRLVNQMKQSKEKVKKSYSPEQIIKKGRNNLIKSIRNLARQFDEDL